MGGELYRAVLEVLEKDARAARKLHHKHWNASRAHALRRYAPDAARRHARAAKAHEERADAIDSHLERLRTIAAEVEHRANLAAFRAKDDGAAFDGIDAAVARKLDDMAPGLAKAFDAERAAHATRLKRLGPVPLAVEE
jgi:3-dehydroquinate dehydratase